MKPVDTIDFHLRWGWTKLSRLYASEAERRGIPFSYVFILLHTEREGTPSTQLGPKMGMEPTSLSRSLRSMETMGLIERLPDLIDGRVMRVFLTKEGVGARRQARDLVVTVNERLRELLGIDSVNRLLEEMKRLNEILDQPEELLLNIQSKNLKPQTPS
jgi:DNA-binding MarR family transcriptional regulator|tara:strand:- start:4095 stop:4571 length:477 start_codon:yes stop_codon:yes gene_type:complete